MFSRFLQLVLVTLVVAGASIVITAQPPEIVTDASARDYKPTRKPGDGPMGMKEMLAKQRAERDKRDHEEMLERGEEALRLTKQLEASFAQNKTFSQQDRTRLESLEKVVEKIRKELGGDDDEELDGTEPMKAVDAPKPSTLEEAFEFLQTTTVKLVDELKKTTRFSISAIAIQTSNNVLKIVRFLRLKK